MKISRVNVLGIGVSAIDMALATDTIESWIHAHQTNYVCVATVNSVMECQRDRALRRIHNHAGLVTPDGMPLVWLSRAMGFKHVNRVYGPDLMLRMCEISVTAGYRHYFYGGRPGVVDRLKERLERRYPGLTIAGARTPAFQDGSFQYRQLTIDEHTALVEEINRVKPDILWVGLGSPVQERWMAEHLGKLHARALIGVGAAFDFHAGIKRQAPRWMQRAGLEWSFRLMSEPRRLWRRYLIRNCQFVWLLMLQALRLKLKPSNACQPVEDFGVSPGPRKHSTTLTRSNSWQRR